MIRITADTAGDALRQLHAGAGLSRWRFAERLAAATGRTADSVREQLYEWCRPPGASGRRPSMRVYELALAELGMQLAIVPIETPDKGHYGASEGAS